MAASDLVLDRDVRDWVLIPLTVSIFLMMLIRQYVSQVSALLPASDLCIATTCLMYVSHIAGLSVSHSLV